MSSENIIDGIAFQNLTDKELEYSVGLVISHFDHNHPDRSKVRNLMVHAIDAQYAQVPSASDWRRIFLTYIEGWQGTGHFIRGLCEAKRKEEEDGKIV